MRNFTRNVLSRGKYKVLISMVVIVTAFFAYINISNSFANFTTFLTNNTTTVNFKSGEVPITRWDGAHGYVNFGLYPNSSIGSSDPLYSTLESLPHLSNFLYSFDGSSDRSMPNGNFLVYSYLVKYNGDYYMKQSFEKQTYDFPIWFKLEPITWRVLNANDDKVLLLSDKIIDSSIWDSDQNTHRYWDGTNVNRTSNLGIPTINSFLNGTYKGTNYHKSGFYGKAFSNQQKGYILPDKNDSQYTPRDHQEDATPVRILSKYELFNYEHENLTVNNVGTKYGFGSETTYEGAKSKRVAYVTNYSGFYDIKQKEDTNNPGNYSAAYWTMTRKKDDTYEVAYVKNNGNCSDIYLPSDTNLGVRPVITVSADFFNNETIYGDGTASNPYYAMLDNTVTYNLGNADSGQLVPAQTNILEIDEGNLETNTLVKADTELAKVTFNYNGLTKANDEVYNYTKYLPNGWATTSGGSKVYENNQLVYLTSDLDLYPAFDTSVIGALFPMQPTREGYTFGGWNTKADGTGETVTSYTGSSNITLYAKWIGNTYNNKIIFVGNGGTLAVDHMECNVTYPNTQGVFSIPNSPTKDGYTFDGWYDSPSGGSQHDFNHTGENNIAHDQVTYVYAHYTRTGAPTTEVELIVNANGGLYEGEASKVYSVHKHDGSETEGGACYSVTYHVHTGDSVNGGGCYEHIISDTQIDGLTPKICDGQIKVINNSSWHYRIDDVTGYYLTYYHLACERCGHLLYEDSWCEYEVNDNWPGRCSQPSGQYEGTILTCDYKNHVSGEQVPGNVESFVKNCSLNDYQVISNPVKDGYTFTGWSSSTEYNTYSESSETRWKGDSDTTITANYSANTYTVSFNADNGGNNPANQTVTYDSAYGTLPTPTKTGYDFEGWYTSNTGGSKVISATIVNTASNHTLYARYTPKNIVVSFDNGYFASANPSPITVIFNSAYGTLPSGDTRTGYNFLGWFTSESGGTEVTSSTLVTNGSNHTLYGRYSPKVFDIIYNRGDATSTNVPANQIATYDSNLTLAVNNMTKDDMANGYVITYDMGIATGGELPSASIQTTSYTADGWSGYLNGLKLFDSGYVFSPYKYTNGFALYPHWIETKNKVTLESNTLTKDPTVKSTVTYKYQDGVTSDVNRNVMSLYTPNGWSTTNGGAKVYNNADEIDPSSNMDLYPYFDSINEPVTFPANPERTGYTFGGWNTKADGTGETVTSYNGTSDLTLYAIWNGISFTNTLKYSANGGDNAPSDDIANVTYPNTKHTFTISSQIPTKAGYNFKGWYTQAGGGTKVSSSQAFGDDNVLNNQVTYIYAHWEKIGVITSVELTINPSGGIYDGDTNVKTYEVHVHDGSTTEEGECYNVVYHTHTDACKSISYKYCNNQTGTILSGYDYDANSRMCTIRCSLCGGTCNNLVNKAYPDGYNVSGCLLQHQNPTPTITYTCSFGSYNGDHVPGNIESATITCTEADFKVIDIPVKTGYTFTGWTSDTGIDTYTESSETRWKGNSDTVLTANYSVNTYTVSFDADNGGNNPANQTVTYDSAYGSLPSVSKTGYTFLGWYTQASGGNLVTSTTTVTTASNHTLYAHYSVKKPTLYFNANYPLGVNPGSKEITYGEMYGTLPTMSRDGYTFVGWFTDATSGSEITGTSIVNVENDQTLYAHYSANNYTITYYQGDATSTNVPSSQTATFDSNVTLATNSMTKSDTLSGYTITYNMGRADSGTLPVNVTQSYSYSADGWSTLSSGTKVYASGHTFSPYNLTNNLNLYPAWTTTKNNVTLATNDLVRDDMAVSTVTFKYQDGTTSDETRDVIRSYTNDGWGTTIDGNKVYNDGEVITPSSNIILYPSYTYVDTPITFPASPSQAGYTFREWNTSVDGTGTAYTSYVGTSNLTLYAIWDGISYTNTLKYDVTTNGGSAVIADDTKTVTYPNTISNHTLTSIVPTKTGYDFIGWYDMPTGGNYITSSVSVGINNYVGNQDKTIYAQFDKNKYTVSFKNKDKTQDLFTPLRIEYNDQIGDIYDASHIPTLDGYLFGGWYLDTDSTYQNKITSSYLVTSNITLVPRWYEVSFDALNKTYDGNIVEPVITVSDDSTPKVVLTKDNDYTVSDTGDKINYGSRTITVSGDNSKGIYGSVSKTFTIERKPINYSDVIILNYNNTDNTINKEFDLNDKTNVKILANDIILAYSGDTNIRFNFDLDNSYYSSASPSNSIHKDITLSNIRIDSATSNNHYYNGPPSLTFTGYGMIKDTTEPVVNSCEIISPSNIYGLGQEILFKVITNEDLIPSGTPVIKLKINSPSDNDMGYADFDTSNPLNDSHTFIFKHIVTAGDNGVLGKLKLALEIIGGTYSDSCGNELDRTLDDSNQDIKDIEINTDGFVIPSSMIPNILTSETTSDNEVIVTYDLSDISLFTGYSLDTLIANLTVNCDIDNVITNITSDNNIVTITKDDSGANKKVTVKVDTTKILNETTNYRNGIKLTFDIPKEVLVNDINNKNIASHNEIKVLRTLNDSDIIVKHNGNILDHLGTIYKAYENDVIEVLLKDGALGTLSYDQSPNTIISNTLYKFTKFILTKVNYVSSVPFNIEFKVRSKQDVLDDINAIITDPNKDDDEKTNDLKDILDNKKDLDFFNPPLTDDDIDYIINNPDDISKIFISDNKDIIPDDSTLVDKLKDAIEKDKANKAYKPKKKKKKLNVKEEETVIDDKGEEKVITHVPYLVGYKDKTIRPDGNITRGEISSLISHISSDYDSGFDYTPNITKFKDSNKNAWHSNYLGFLAKENIFEGYSDKTIKSERYITRGEFAKTICVLFELDTKETNKNKKHVFKDSKNKWYEEYANTLWEYGYIEGYNDNTFRGNKSITRAEAVKIINKALDRKLKDDTTLTEEERLEFENKFIDVLHKWYYYDLFEATMSY